MEEEEQVAIAQPPPDDELMELMFGGYNTISNLFAYSVDAGNVMTLTQALAYAKDRRKENVPLIRTLNDVMKGLVTSTRVKTKLRLPPTQLPKINWNELTDRNIYNWLKDTKVKFLGEETRIRLPLLDRLPASSKLLKSRARTPGGGLEVVSFADRVGEVFVPSFLSKWDSPLTLDQMLANRKTIPKPRFDPEGHVSGYDKSLLEVTVRIAEFMPDKAPGKAAMYAMHEFTKSVETHILCNGSPQGLVGRIRATLARVEARSGDTKNKMVVFDGDRQYKNGAFTGTQESYNTILGALAPFATRDPNLKLFTFAIGPLDQYYTNEKDNLHISITNKNPRSDPGIVTGKHS